MTDILVQWSQTSGVGDILVNGPDLAGDDTLATAVLVSLFSDQRISLDERPPGETGQRGWWGDALSESDQIGSKLWLLDREKQTNEVLVRAEEYAGEALAWMIEDGVAASVDVTAEWVSRGVLGVRVEISLPQGGAVEYQFTTVQGV